jgi:hypothetical protein
MDGTLDVVETPAVPVRRAGRNVLVAAAVLCSVAGCTSSPDAADTSGWPASDGVVVLAKADGWRDGLDRQALQEYFSVVEIAYNAATARTAWADAVPADLPERDGEPRESGRYGDLDGVDFDRQVLVVYSSGQSGSCPGWLGDVSTADGTVQLMTDAYVPDEVCTDDYGAYRVVVAVDRDRLPDEAELPTEDVRVDGSGLSALAAAYPVR